MTDHLDHDVLQQIFTRGGSDAVKRALDDFARTAGDEQLNAAVDQACAVIAADTARITAVADQREAGIAELEAQARALQKELDELAAETAVRLVDHPPADD
ncbi:hypothetical protein [Streptomyces sp. NBC_01353]|uniref:hypothetical protein n=1 Tax=Streptomyces sp. NBC_01353 TaxID=2903835 RepID=UPI002E341BAA|nr:hypothetical protein [Streptomyces sp. NBC_01353]